MMRSLALGQTSGIDQRITSQVPDIDYWPPSDLWPADERGVREIFTTAGPAAAQYAFNRSNEMPEANVPSQFDVANVNEGPESSAFGSVLASPSGAGAGAEVDGADAAGPSHSGPVRIRMLDNYYLCDQMGQPVSLSTLVHGHAGPGSQPVSGVQAFGTIVSGLGNCGIRGRPSYPRQWRAAVLAARGDHAEAAALLGSAGYGRGGDGHQDGARRRGRRKKDQEADQSRNLVLQPRPADRALGKEECHQRAAQMLSQASFPLVLNSHLSIENLGRIVPRLAYHSDKYIWPVGFRAHRMYADYLDLSKKQKYLCEVLDGGEAGPVFRVTHLGDPQNPSTARTATAAWTAINERVVDARKREANDDHVPGQRVPSGPELFGLAGSKAALLIEGLPGALECAKYVFTELREGSANFADAIAGSGGAGAAASRKRKMIDVEDGGAGDGGGGGAYVSSVSTPSSAQQQPTSKRPKLDGLQARIYEAVRGVIRSDLEADPDATVSLKDVRMRVESQLGLDLTDKRELLKQMLERVLAEHDEGIDSDDDEQVDNGDGAAVSPPAGGAVTGMRFTFSSAGQHAAAAPQHQPFGDDDTNLWPRGVPQNRQRMRVHIPAVSSIEILLSGPIVSAVGGPCVVLRSASTAAAGGIVYVISTSTEPDVSPSKPYRLSARSQLFALECCSIAMRVVAQQAASGATLRYRETSIAIDEAGKQFLDQQLDSSDVRGSGQLVQEESMVNNAEQVTRALKSVPNTTLPDAAREKFCTVILLKNRLHQRTRLKDRIQVVLDAAEAKVTRPGEELMLVRRLPPQDAACLEACPLPAEVANTSKQVLKDEALLFSVESMPQPVAAGGDSASVAGGGSNEAAAAGGEVAPNSTAAQPSASPAAAQQQQQNQNQRPAPTPLFDEKLIAQPQGEDILSAWSFLQAFSHPIGLTPYRLDDLAAALLYSGGDSALVTSTFVQLLKLIVDDRQSGANAHGGPSIPSLADAPPDGGAGAGGADDQDGKAGAAASSAGTAGAGAVPSSGSKAKLFGITAEPNVGTWQEYLRLAIEDGLSDVDKARLKLQKLSLSRSHAAGASDALVAASSSSAAAASSSTASSNQSVPLGPVLTVCARALESIMREPAATMLMGPIDSTVFPHHATVVHTWVDLLAIKKRLSSGYYGSIFDDEIYGSANKPAASAMSSSSAAGGGSASLIIDVDDAATSTAKPAVSNGGVEGGAAYLSGYKGWASDMRLLFANSKALSGENTQTTFYHAVSKLYSDFEEAMEARIRPLAGQLAGDQKMKQLSSERRGNPQLRQAPVQTRPGTLEVAIALGTADFRSLPLNVKVAALAWLADEAASTSRLRHYIESASDAASEALIVLKAADENKANAVRASAICHYKQQVLVKLKAMMLDTDGPLSPKALDAEIQRLVAALRSMDIGTEVQLQMLLAEISAAPKKSDGDDAPAGGAAAATVADPTVGLMATLTDQSKAADAERQAADDALTSARHRLSALTTRPTPIGYDRKHRRYWLMCDIGDTDASKPHYTQPQQPAESTSRTTLRVFVEDCKDRSSQMLNGGLALDHDDDEQDEDDDEYDARDADDGYQLNPSTAYGPIRCYSTTASISQLVSWLAPNGLRESSTLSSLNAALPGMRSRLETARSESRAYRESLSHLLTVTRTSLAQHRKDSMQPLTTVHAGTVAPLSYDVAVQLLASTAPEAHDMDRQVLAQAANAHRWSAAVGAAAGTAGSGSPAGGGPSHTPHQINDCPYCAHCGTMVSNRWYSAFIKGRQVTPAASGAQGSRKMCLDCYGYAHGHNMALRPLSAQETILAQLTQRAVGPGGGADTAGAGAGAASAASSSSSASAAGGAGGDGVNPTEHTLALQLLDSLQLFRAGTEGAIDLQRHLPTFARYAVTVGVATERILPVAAEAPVIGADGAPVTPAPAAPREPLTAASINGPSYLTTAFPAPAGSICGSHYDSCSALQLKLLQLEARLCHPAAMPGWRYTRRRQEWRGHVAAALSTRSDIATAAIWTIRDAIRNTLTAIPADEDASLQIAAAHSLSVPAAQLASLSQSRVSTLSTCLLMLEEAVHNEVVSKRALPGVLRDTWLDNRESWRKEVTHAQTLSQVSVFADRFRDRAVDWESIGDSVSEIDRASFLKVSFDRGGGVLPNFTNTSCNATVSQMTTRGSGTMVGASSISYIPAESEELIYYGDGYAEAIHIARAKIAEQTAQRERASAAAKAGSRPGGAGGRDAHGASEGGSGAGSGGSADALRRRTCSEVLSQLVPLPGTALCRVTQVTYHAGGDTEPYAKVKMGVVRWLHAAPATLDPPATAATAPPTMMATASMVDQMLSRALEDSNMEPVKGLQVQETETGPGLGISGLSIQENMCVVCGGGGDLIGCDFDRCGRFYHLGCVGLTTEPAGNYFCPMHYCGMCNTAIASGGPTTRAGTTCAASCVSCASSYCADCFNAMSLPANTGVPRAGTTAPAAGGCLWDQTAPPGPYGVWRCGVCIQPRRRIQTILRRACVAMREHSDSTPFRHAVDPSQYPDYRHYVSDPIALDTIENKMAHAYYTGLSSFVADCKLLLDNCEKYCEGRYNHLPQQAHAVVFAGLRTIADARTVEDLRRAELDLFASSAGKQPNEMSYAQAGEKAKASRASAFTDAAAYLTRRLKKAGAAYDRLQGSSSSAAPEYESIDADGYTWARDTSVPLPDFTAAVLILGNRARAEALHSVAAEAEAQLADVKAEKLPKCEHDLATNTDILRQIQDAALHRSQQVIDQWKAANISRLTPQDLQAQAAAMRDQEYQRQISTIREFTLNNMVMRDMQPLLEAAKSKLTARAQNVHPTMDVLARELIDEFGPGSIPGFVPPPSATSSSGIGSSSNLSVAQQQADSYVQSFTVIVRLQAQTSDFLIPLDRYVAAVNNKFEIGSEFASFKITAPEGLSVASGLAYGQHGSAVSKVIEQAERTLGNKKFRDPNLQPSIKKALNYSIAQYLANSKTDSETKRPVVRLGKVYTGKIVGSLMLDLSETAAQVIATSCGLMNPVESSTRLFAVPWRSLCIRWYDLKYAKGAPTSYDNIWEHATITSITRVNPWESIDHFEQPRTIQLSSALPPIGRTPPQPAALWDIGIAPVLTAGGEPDSITYKIEQQAVPPHLVPPPVQAPVQAPAPVAAAGAAGAGAGQKAADPAVQQQQLQQQILMQIQAVAQGRMNAPSMTQAQAAGLLANAAALQQYVGQAVAQQMQAAAAASAQQAAHAQAQQQAQQQAHATLQAHQNALAAQARAQQAAQAQQVQPSQQQQQLAMQQQLLAQLQASMPAGLTPTQQQQYLQTRMQMMQAMMSKGRGGR